MMKLAIACALVVVTTAQGTFFKAGDAPKCFMRNGRTVVHYDHVLHKSFKCTHNQAGTACSCAFEHPTHAKGGCKTFDHEKTTHKIGGDCSETGRTPIDGGFSQWGAWGACSATCGAAKQSRSRTCTSPAPKYNGKPCAGAATEQKNCNLATCAVQNFFGKRYNCGQVHTITTDTNIKGAQATLYGGDGGSAPTDHPASGSRGGITTVKFDLHAGDKVEFIAGCKGFNGPGNNGGRRPGGGGGGGTAIKVNGVPIAVAGGGGGAAGCFAKGGRGGGVSGFGGHATYYRSVEATGGSQSGPGRAANGDRGEPRGSPGSGHDGGHAGGRDVYSYSRSFGFGRGGGSTQRSGDCGGGGGGGGYFGGGGGAAGGHGHSGAGGSGHCSGNSRVVSCSTYTNDASGTSIERSHGPRVSSAGATGFSGGVDGKIEFIA